MSSSTARNAGKLLWTSEIMPSRTKRSQPRLRGTACALGRNCTTTTMKHLWAALAAALLTLTLGAPAALAANPPPPAPPPPAAPKPAAAAPAPPPEPGKQIVVSLGQEKLFAYMD